MKYCIRCGKTNDDKRKRCKKCYQKLEPKEHLMIDYFIEKGIGKAEEGFFKNFKKFVIHYLYGFVMTCSILLTSVSIIVTSYHSSTSYIEKVTEKPTFVMKTETLTEDENLKFFNVALSYVDAVQAGNIEIANSYLLENHYPEILKEIESNPDYWNPVVDIKKTVHPIMAYGQKLFQTTMEKDYHIVKTPKIGKYGTYFYQSYHIYMNYCSFDSCTVKDGKEEPDFTLGFMVEVVKVNDAYYVIREYDDFPSYNRTLTLDILNANQWEVWNINFDGIIERYGICIGDHTDEYCLKAVVH